MNENGMMTRKELLAALKDAREVFGYVVATENDGYYLPLTKSAVKMLLEQTGGESIKAHVRPDENNALYIG